MKAKIFIIAILLFFSQISFCVNASDIIKNWQDDDIRAASQDLQNKKFNKAIVRMEQINLGHISAERKTPDGERLFSLKQVGHGDILSFKIVKNSTWTENCLVNWEIRNPTKLILLKTKKISATEPGASNFTYTCMYLPPGTYEVFFRMYDKKSNKQMDYSTIAFTVSNDLDIGPIVAFLDNNEPFAGTVLLEERLEFTIKKIGKWDNKHTIEWFLDGGSPRKSKTADTIDITRMGIRFDEYYDLGRHKVSVRAIDNKTQKIVAYQELSFNLVKEKNKPLKKMIIEAVRDSKTGKLAGLPLVVSSKEVVWMRAKVTHPKPLDPIKNEPIPTIITWRLYDDNNKVLGEKVEQHSETGGVHERWMKPRIDKLQDGKYTLEVIHSLASDEKISTSTSYFFAVVNLVKNLQLWVTHTKDDTKDRTPLKIGQIPHLYASFELGPDIEIVETTLSAINKKTGQELYSLTRQYKHKKDQKIQKTGIRLGEKGIDVGETILFSVVVKLDGDQLSEAEMVFKIVDYSLSLKVTKTIESDRTGHYQILLPKEFTPPYKVSIRSLGLNIDNSGKELSGAFTGTAQNKDQSYSIKATVVDKQGLSAKGIAFVTVKAFVPKKIAYNKQDYKPKDGEHPIYEKYDKYDDPKWVYFFKDGKLKWRKHYGRTTTLLEPYQLGKGNVAIKQLSYDRGHILWRHIKKQQHDKRIWVSKEGFEKGRLDSKKTDFPFEDYPPEFLYSRKEIQENECFRNFDSTWLTGLSFSKAGKITSIAMYERMYNNRKDWSTNTAAIESKTHWKFRSRTYFNEKGREIKIVKGKK